jgi:mRNA interferase RelE/StbE
LAFRILYKSSVSRDLKSLDRNVAERILRDLEDTLKRDPDNGIPLSEQFKGLFKMRIGDYRVIYSKAPEGVLILRIGHRRKIYSR